VELSFGAGINWTTVLARSSMASNPAAGLAGNVVALKKKERLLGGYLKASADYYVSRNVSVQIKVQRTILPRFDVPALEIVDPGTGARRVLVGHELDFSATEVSLGVALHI